MGIQECMSKTHELLLEGLLEHGRLRSHQLFSRAAASPDYDEETVRQFGFLVRDFEWVLTLLPLSSES